MKSIKIAGKEFTLGSRFARLFAFLIDGMLLAGVLSVLVFLFDGMGSGFIASLVRIGLLSILLWILGPRTKLSEDLLQGIQMIIIALLGPWANYDSDTLLWGGVSLGTIGLLFIDGFNDGQGPGKKLLSLQVLRSKDGKPCTLKDSFIRRITSIFQPLDSLWTFGKQRQRMGDKLADTIVVKLAPEAEQSESEAEDPEAVFESAIAEMKTRISVARQKVDASVGVEKQFQDAYEGAVAEVEKWQERAVIDLKAGREDLAREDLAKRNQYRKLADQYKKRWKDQKQVIQALSDLLEYLQQEMIETEGKKAVVVAQHRNVDAEAHLRETLKEIQDNKTSETLAKMEQDTTEAATLAKAAAEMDVAYQEAKSEREFASYAEAASVDKDLAELKAKLQQ
ncbi:MAG: PspA/IM30 family protein [Candidatus Poribacteria bacterium]|nr:PspA/IM30 family protein [Candidatus Poribacteria bacterium]